MSASDPIRLSSYQRVKLGGLPVLQQSENQFVFTSYSVLAHYKENPPNFNAYFLKEKISNIFRFWNLLQSTRPDLRYSQFAKYSGKISQSLGKISLSGAYPDFFIFLNPSFSQVKKHWRHFRSYSPRLAFISSNTCKGSEILIYR